MFKTERVLKYTTKWQLIQEKEKKWYLIFYLPQFAESKLSTWLAADETQNPLLFNSFQCYFKGETPYQV